MPTWLEKDAALSAQLRVAEKPGPLRTLAGFLAHSGDSWFWLIGLVLVWRFGSRVWRTRAKVMAGSILGTAILTQTLKFIFRRERPQGKWGNIYRKTDPYSFPSGHAARAGLLTVLGAVMGPVWFGVALLIWGPLTALARVAMGVHYISDVIAGFTLGMGIAGSITAIRKWVIPFDEDKAGHDGAG